MITVEDVINIVNKNKEEAKLFLQECLQTPSATGDEEAMATVVEKWIKKAGLIPQRYQKTERRPNIVAEWKGSGNGKRFVFNGHIDVFPPVKGDDGLFGPWSGKVEDGYIYGRGAADMKSGVCASIMAVKYLRELGYNPAGSVLLTYVCDEENCGNFGIKYLVEKDLIQGDFGVCMEPTCGGVLIEHAGNLRMRVTYRSPTAHTCNPHPTADALTKCLDAVKSLQILDEKVRWYSEELNAWSKLTVTVIDAGNVPNMYASEGTFYIDRRILPGEDINVAERQILDTLDALNKEKGDLDYSYDCQITGRVPPLVISPDSEIVHIARKAHEDITGTYDVLYKRTGFSDAAHIMEATGMDMPNYGPGLEWEEMCMPDEKIALESYYDFIKIYMMMVLRALGEHNER